MTLILFAIAGFGGGVAAGDLWEQVRLDMKESVVDTSEMAGR